MPTTKNNNDGRGISGDGFEGTCWSAEAASEQGKNQFNIIAPVVAVVVGDENSSEKKVLVIAPHEDESIHMSIT